MGCNLGRNKTNADPTLGVNCLAKSSKLHHGNAMVHLAFLVVTFYP